MPTGTRKSSAPTRSPPHPVNEAYSKTEQSHPDPYVSRHLPAHELLTAAVRHFKRSRPYLAKREGAGLSPETGRVGRSPTRGAGTTRPAPRSVGHLCGPRIITRPPDQPHTTASGLTDPDQTGDMWVAPRRPEQSREQKGSRPANDGHLPHTSRSTRGTWDGRCNPAKGALNKPPFSAAGQPTLTGSAALLLTTK